MNNKTINLSIKYFQTQSNYFWQWAENGTVIEWKNGQTICYREELVDLLKALEPNGFPPLDTVLLLLSACQNSWLNLEEKKRILKDVLILIKSEVKDKQYQEIEIYVKNGLNLLDKVAALPILQKTQINRSHLLREVFSQTRFKLPSGISKEMLALFKSGEYDTSIFKSNKATSPDEFKLAFGCLIDCLGIYKNTEELSTQLKTGLRNIPELQKLELPEQETESLITQLSENDKTHGLSKLTQRLMAILHIPMHTKGVSDQAYGGISDITNRGDFDRLLLSELAHDEVSLIARLVNNEALYYHHESPPVQQHQHRMILLDSTIKMWGLPRVFGLSAALACAQNTKKGISTAAYMLKGKVYENMDLNSKEGVLTAMEQLDGHLDCSQALFDFFEMQNHQENIENVFITTENVFKNKKFYPHLTFLQQKLDYLITVNRTGILQFFQFKNGKRKLLNTLQVNLKEHLFSQKKTKQKHTINKTLPIFFNQKPTPLHFPTPSIKLSKYNTYISPNKDILVVTKDQRLLYWKKGAYQATEVLHYIASGNYYFGTSENKVYIIAHDKNTVIWHVIDLQTGIVNSVDYSDRVKMSYHGAQFKGKYFFIEAYPNSFLINCETQELIENQRHELMKVIGITRINQTSLDFGYVRKEINGSYNTLQKPRRVFVDETGHLRIGGHRLRIYLQYLQWMNSKFEPNQKVIGTKSKSIHSLQKIEETGLSGNPKIKFCRTIFDNGSEAIMDSRGLLYLRSANKKLPEVTIIMIVGQGTAAWSSDGNCCGYHYFLNKKCNDTVLPIQTFYKKYIQAFIDALK